MNNTLIEMSEGNPGAINALMELLKNGGESSVLKLKELGITGWKIWVCYSDICKKDINLLKNKISDGSIMAKLKETPDWKYYENK